jgi:hypothetical protein
MKYALLAVVALLALPMVASASQQQARETTLGNVVAVERVFTPDVDACIANFKEAGTNSYGCYVEVQVATSPYDQLITSSEQNIVTSGCNLWMMAGATGYHISVTSSNAMTLLQAQDCLRMAFITNKLDRSELTALVHTIRATK